MAINVTLKLRDSFGRETTKRIETNETVLSDAETAVATLLTDLAAITDLECIGSVYSSKKAADTFAGAGTSNVDVGATFSVLTGTGKRASHKVPGFPLSKVEAGGTIDVTDVDVAAYFALFETGGSLRLSDGEYIVSVLSGQLDE